MPLAFLPDVEVLFLWGSEGAPRAVPELAREGETWTTTLVGPEGLAEVHGLKLPLLATATRLALVPAAELESLSGSLATWTLASKLALDLVARELVVPTITRQKGRLEARWAGSLASGDDASKVASLARSMPPAAHAVPVSGDAASLVWAPDALLRAYIDALVDALVRAAQGGPGLPAAVPLSRKRDDWSDRFRSALAGPERSFDTRGFGERSVVDEIERWSQPALGARDRLRACFRLELPEADGAPFLLRFLLQAPDDPSLMLPAAEVWEGKGRGLEKLGRAFRDPEESLLEALGRAARLFSPIARSLEVARPESVELDPATAWTFLGEGAAALAEAGFGVIVPGELTAAGRRRLRLRMRVGGTSKKVAGVVAGAAGLGLDELLAVDWQAIVGDEALTARELAELARHKAPLVRFRGAWVVAELVERLRNGAATQLEAPRALNAELRPYQARGLNWLVTMASLGLGACLADDMGLGKTMQLLAFLLHRLEQAPADTRPALLIAPTSVVGNWERELERFAPSLSIFRHYGAERARTQEDFGESAVVVTSYGLLRRDAELLSGIDWSVVALDEAQNIKNAASATARAARSLRASHRFALTGTPVENRLAELWSILEFGNPGLLGPLETFRREFALPIERHGNEDAASRLRRIVGPFVLRRLKSDPAIIQDLPPKNEMKVVCTLTREQATLYKAVVDEELLRIESSDGIERRGRVLALLTFTKQICNHRCRPFNSRSTSRARTAPSCVSSGRRRRGRTRRAPSRLSHPSCALLRMPPAGSRWERPARPAPSRRQPRRRPRKPAPGAPAASALLEPTEPGSSRSRRAPDCRPSPSSPQAACRRSR